METITSIKKELQNQSMAAFHSDEPWTEKDDNKRNALIEKLEQLQEGVQDVIIKAWIPGLKDATYKVLRMVGNVDMVVINVETKKEYLISRYQIIE